MNSSNLNSQGRSNDSFSSKNSSGSQSSNDHGIQSKQLMTLFEDELKDIYWAEKALTKAIPKMIKNARSQELLMALTSHLSETENQVSRVEQVFEAIGKRSSTKKCEAMEGLIAEAEDIMSSCDEGVMRDAGIISAAQKVEHYEIASYGTLRQFAETLGINKAVELLKATLDEEKAADKKLTEVCVNIVSVS